VRSKCGYNACFTLIFYEAYIWAHSRRPAERLTCGGLDAYAYLATAALQGVDIAKALHAHSDGAVAVAKREHGAFAGISAASLLDT
jgi:hypothetical protein